MGESASRSSEYHLQQLTVALLVCWYAVVLTVSLSVLSDLTFCWSQPGDSTFQMSQLLLGATGIVLLLVGFLSLDIMGFAFWKGNQFPVEGKVSAQGSHTGRH